MVKGYVVKLVDTTLSIGCWITSIGKYDILRHSELKNLPDEVTIEKIMVVDIPPRTKLPQEYFSFPSLDAVYRYISAKNIKILKYLAYNKPITPLVVILFVKPDEQQKIIKKLSKCLEGYNWKTVDSFYLRERFIKAFDKALYGEYFNL